MRKKIWCILFINLSLLSGCTWQRVATPPAYVADGFKFTVGMRPEDDPTSIELANLLASELKNINTFDDIIYPYRSDDAVDCILEVKAVATMEGEGAAAGVFSGLTFGLGGLFMGPETTIIHDLDFYLSSGTRRTESRKLHVESEAEFGVFADIQEVVKKQVALHIRKIAIGITEKLKADKSNVVKTCTGRQEGKQR